MDWIEKMKAGMKLIGEACRENKSWNNCEKCPFDELCTSINDDYWGHRWHDMKETMEEVLKESGYSE